MALIALLGTLFFAGVLIATIVVLTKPRNDVRPWALPAEVVFGTIWLTFAWRLHRTGLLLSNAGLRIRWLWRTRTIPWSRVRRFETGPDFMVSARLWVVLIDGDKVRAPIQQVRTRFYGTRVNDGGTTLVADDYRALLRECERQLERARDAKPADH